MTVIRPGALVLVALLLAAGCGDDGASDATTTSSAASTTAVTTSTSSPGGIEQPAIWPAADVWFTDPLTAAGDFVVEVLGVPAELGEFQQGDARSGEVEVLSLGEGGGGRPVARSLLLLRQLGPDDGWFVLGARNEHTAISEPVSGASVPAGPLTVRGVGRGFEATVIVSAFVAGRGGPPLDQVVTQGGAFADAEPFSVRLDLSDAAPGDVVVLLVRGDTGLETDPGDFGAIPVVIAS